MWRLTLAACRRSYTVGDISGGGPTEIWTISCVMHADFKWDPRTLQCGEAEGNFSSLRLYED